MKFISMMAILIDISIKMNNNILKILLVDYAKTKFNKRQMLFLYVKIHTLDTDTKIYSIMNKWLKNNTNQIIKQFLNM